MVHIKTESPELCFLLCVILALICFDIFLTVLLNLQKHVSLFFSGTGHEPIFHYSTPTFLTG